MEDIRPTALDIEPEFPGLTNEAQRPGPPSQVVIKVLGDIAGLA
jgi:hypothetical protein